MVKPINETALLAATLKDVYALLEILAQDAGTRWYASEYQRRMDEIADKLAVFGVKVGKWQELKTGQDYQSPEEVIENRSVNENGEQT